MKFYKITATVEGEGTISCPKRGIICKEGSDLELVCSTKHKIEKWIVNEIPYDGSDRFIISKIDRNISVRVIITDEDALNESFIKKTLKRYFPRLKY